jgi:hypothetical protein
MGEKDWTAGNRAAWTRILSEAIRELGPSAPDAARLIRERAEVVAMLRQVCEVFGDNDWPDDLHLADVIEKHLWRHLEKP